MAIHQQAFLGFFEDMTNKFWRFIVIKNRDLAVERVEFNLVNEMGDVFRRWIAPLQADVLALINRTYVKEPPADVPDAKFGGEEEDRETNAG